MTFTFKEGLVVQVLPNGDIRQQLVSSAKPNETCAVIPNISDAEVSEVVSRTVTR